MLRSKFAKVLVLVSCFAVSLSSPVFAGEDDAGLRQSWERQMEPVLF